jgi:hypothetical protein
MVGGSMELTVCDVHDQRSVEGIPGQFLIEQVNDVTTVLEVCIAQAVDRLLLYTENLPHHEYYPENYQGFVQLGCMVILLHQYL